MLAELEALAIRPVKVSELLFEQPDNHPPDPPCQDEVEAEAMEGGEGKIAFNSRYLLDVLSVLERGKVRPASTTSSARKSSSLPTPTTTST